MINSYLIFLLCCCSTQSFVVKTQQGLLTGTQDVSRRGAPYFSFRGIPYAKPPIGDLRFQDPQDPEPWHELLKAESYGNVCPQFGLNMNDGVFGDEDCLYLNIFTPKLDKTSSLPVVVWIHSGDFVMGSGSIYNPDYIMDNAIVLVTMNYRLGALGFLHLDEQQLSGNYGMKDQAAALNWLKNNIRAFGGDSKRVTVAGQSCDATCVRWHMYWTLNSGFQYAVTQDGISTTKWSTSSGRVTKSRSSMITSLVGCNYERMEETIKCLRNVPAKEFVNAHAKLDVWSFRHECLATVTNTYKKASATRRLEPSDENMPITVGSKRSDVASLVSNDEKPWENLLNANFDILFPSLLMYNIHSKIQSESEMAEVTEKIRKYLFKNRTNSSTNVDKMQNIWSDVYVIYSIAEGVLRRPGVKYLHVFDHSKLTYTKLTNANYSAKSIHCDGLGCFFNGPSFPQESKVINKYVSEMMITLWTNFIMTGDFESPTMAFQRTLSSRLNIEFLNISTDPKMTPWFWKSRFSLLPNLDLNYECLFTTIMSIEALILKADYTILIMIIFILFFNFLLDHR